MGYEKVVDSDGHVMEPPEMWPEYTEANYKDRTIRFTTGQDGLETLLIDKDTVMLSPGVYAALGGVGGYPSGNRQDLWTRGRYTYTEGGPPGSMDPHERIRVLDEEGIDSAVLYPTIGIVWEAYTADADLTFAIARAYNNWLLDFCTAYPDRLFFAAHIPLIDIDMATTEMTRMAKLGARGFFVRPGLTFNKGLGHQEFDRFWATAQDLDLPITPHVTGSDVLDHRKDWFMTPWVTAAAENPGAGESAPHQARVLTFFYLMTAVQAALTEVIISGVFTRYPKAKYIVLETGAGWVPHWLDRLDSKVKLGKPHLPFEDTPSNIFREHCWVTCDPDEEMTPLVANILGDDRVQWASDFPHFDAEMGTVRELMEHIQQLPKESQRKILGENAAKSFNLPM